MNSQRAASWAVRSKSDPRFAVTGEDHGRRFWRPTDSKSNGKVKRNECGR
jgi:hypothetical protein